MSVVTSNNRNTQVISSTTPQVKQQSTQQTDYILPKKVKKEDNCVPVVKTNTNADTSLTSGISSGQNGLTTSNPSYTNGNPNTQLSTNQTQHTEMDYTQSVTTSLTNTINGTMNANGSYMNGLNHIGLNGLTNGYPQQYPSNGMNGMNGNTLDPTGPLPNEIFELLNEFWRPNDLASLENHGMNGKYSRRSPDGSLEDTQEEEKDGEDDLTSIADAEMGVDRNTQKRRYSRLSDGYERLKSVLPSVKDKRRVSKARILDEAINYIQRLESITNVLKREHEKRLSILNGSNGFFPDYSMQPYMRSLFQKQMYPPSKMSQYPKMSTTPTSMLKSPRMKQYNQQYSSQTPSGMSAAVGTNMAATDYNYNNINNNYNSSTMYQSSEMMNGDTSPIANNSPYSACSLSPGSTPTTYPNNSGVNNSWPYQGGGGTAGMTAYNESNPSQISSYNQQQSRQNSTTAANNAYGGSSYTNLNGSNMWSNMNINESSAAAAASQVTPHSNDHSIKVG